MASSSLCAVSGLTWASAQPSADLRLAEHHDLQAVGAQVAVQDVDRDLQPLIRGCRAPTYHSVMIDAAERIGRGQRHEGQGVERGVPEIGIHPQRAAAAGRDRGRARARIRHRGVGIAASQNQGQGQNSQEFALGRFRSFGRLDGVLRASPLRRAYTWPSEGVQCRRGNSRICVAGRFAKSIRA